MQGLWRRYLLRLAHVGELRTIEGVSREVHITALHLSFLLAPAVKFLRYFQEDDQKHGEPEAWEARVQHSDPNKKHDLYEPRTPEDADLAYKFRRPAKTDRTTYDGIVDDYQHPYYDPVFSEVPPGERFVMHDGTKQVNPMNNVWKRVKNGNLLYPTLPTYELRHTVEIHGNTSAEKHYEMRLYNALSWIQFYVCQLDDPNRTGFSPFDSVIATPMPHEIQMSPSSIQECFKRYPGQCVRLRQCPSALQINWELFDFWVAQETVPRPPNFYEEVCKWFDTSFSSSSACECCQKADQQERCPWCFNAHGWHRCQQHCLQHGLSLNDPQAFRWKTHSLFNINDIDVERVFFDMLADSKPLKNIEEVLKEQMNLGNIETLRANALLKVAVARNDVIADMDPVGGPSNQSYVLSHNEFEGKSAADLNKALTKLQMEMQQLYCEESKEMKLYSDFNPARQVPTQYLAFQQLQYRYADTTAPFLVCCVAPAGFGKSTLISAWLHWLYVNHKEKWQTVAPTGIAATQIKGATIHAALVCTPDYESKIADHPTELARFTTTPGFIIDECMMLSSKIMSPLQDMCQKYPLEQSLRKPGRGGLFGYRSIVLCGDLRQIRP